MTEVIGSDIQVTLSQCQSTWEIELVVRMVSCENRIKTKDLSLVLNGDLLRRETFIKGLFFLSWILVLVSVINMEKNSEKLRDSSKPTITCYIHSQSFMNHLNKNLNYNFKNLYFSFCKAFWHTQFLSIYWFGVQLWKKTRIQKYSIFSFSFIYCWFIFKTMASGQKKQSSLTNLLQTQGKKCFPRN